MDPCTKLCNLLFHIIRTILFLPLDPAKLAKISQAGASVKAKDQAYTALAQYFKSPLSWYKKTRSLCVVKFLGAHNYSCLLTQRLMTPVFSFHPECFFELLS